LAPSMAFISLDILLEILSYVDTCDLPAICRLNKATSAFAQDALYREIKHRNALDACITISNNPVLATRVRSLDLTLIATSRSDLCHKAISTALRKSVNLRALSIRFGPTGSSVLRRCTAKLVSFQCGFFCNDDVVSFLNRQTELREITLSLPHSNEARHFVDKNALPHLKKLSAPLSWARKLVPGRPTDNITIRGYSWDPSDVDLDFLAFSTSSVRDLELDHSFLYNKSLSKMTTIFPAITNLKLFSINIKILDENSERAEEFLEHTTRLLRALATLRHVTLVIQEFFPTIAHKAFLPFVVKFAEDVRQLDRFTVFLSANAGVHFTWIRNSEGWVLYNEI
jgi:hypothetical protein